MLQARCRLECYWFAWLPSALALLGLSAGCNRPSTGGSNLSAGSSLTAAAIPQSKGASKMICANGVCSDPNLSVVICGGKTCGANQICCGTTCTTIGLSNCGACGAKCSTANASSFSCNTSGATPTCQYTCNTGFANCSATPPDTSGCSINLNT